MHTEYLEYGKTEQMIDVEGFTKSSKTPEVNAQQPPAQQQLQQPPQTQQQQLPPPPPQQKQDSGFYSGPPKSDAPAARGVPGLY